MSKSLLHGKGGTPFSLCTGSVQYTDEQLLFRASGHRTSVQSKEMTVGSTLISALCVIRIVRC